MIAGLQSEYQQDAVQVVATGLCERLFDLSERVLQTSTVVDAVNTEQGSCASMPHPSYSPASKRKREHDAGRALAAELLKRLRSDSLEVSTGDSREPLWPSGFVGSITHTDRVIAVAVARACETRALGIDSEQLVEARTASDIAMVCLTTRERLWCKRASDAPSSSICTLLFSVKESLFKCIFPLVYRYFDFLDVEVVDIDWRRGLIQAVLLNRLSAEFPTGSVLEGRFRFSLGHVHTSFELSLS